jgi:hypothetical protein
MRICKCIRRTEDGRVHVERRHGNASAGAVLVTERGKQHNHLNREDLAPPGDWRARSFDARKLHPGSASSVDQVLVDRLIEDYKKAPKNSAYSELTLLRVLEDGEGGGRRYFVFNIQYIDHLEVVYVLDSRNVILDKLLISPWMR